MLEKKKLRLKKFYFHPVTVFLFLIFVTIILSGILSIFQIQATYNTVNPNTLELEPILVTVENLFSFDGIKVINHGNKNIYEINLFVTGLEQLNKLLLVLNKSSFVEKIERAMRWEYLFKEVEMLQ